MSDISGKKAVVLLFLTLLLVMLEGCEQPRQTGMTPWGTLVDNETGAPLSPVPSVPQRAASLQITAGPSVPREDVRGFV